MRIGYGDRGYKWYMVKFGVILLFLGIVLVLKKNEIVMKFPPARVGGRRLMGDEDGNSDICHQIASFEGNQCQYARKECSEPLAGAFLNYLNLRYCSFSGVKFVLYYILLIVWLLVLFYILGDVADSNFCPSLTEMVKYLRLGPDVAGVTLLALGNGAPDISSILAGVLGGSSGISVGEPVGASLFVTTFVVAAVTLVSNVKVLPVSFLRDTGFYFLSILFVFIVILTGEFKLWQSLLCLFLYFLYVILVVLTERITGFIKRRKIFSLFKRKPENQEKTSLLGNRKINRYDGNESDHSDEDLDTEWYIGKKPSFIATTDGSDSILGIPHDQWDDAEMYVVPKFAISQVIKKHKKEDQKEKDHKGKPHQPPVQEPNSELLGAPIINDYMIPEDHVESEIEIEQKRHFFWRIVPFFVDWIGWNDMSIFSKIFFVVFSPTILLRNLTIPKSDPDEWSRFFAVLCPIFIPWFFLLAIQQNINIPGTKLPLGAILTVGGILVAVFVFFTTNSRRTPIYHPISVLLGFIMGITWLYIAANELVGVLQSIGILWEVSDAILAVTVLTFGNSIGDLIANTVVSRAGFPAMGIAACYQPMNLMVGIGLSITFYNIQRKEPFPLSIDPTVLLAFVMVMVGLLSSIVITVINRFRIPKTFGIFMICFYGAFITIAILMEKGLLMPPLKE